MQNQIIKITNLWFVVIAAIIMGSFIATTSRAQGIIKEKTESHIKLALNAFSFND